MQIRNAVQLKTQLSFRDKSFSMRLQVVEEVDEPSGSNVICFDVDAPILARSLCRTLIVTLLVSETKACLNGQQMDKRI